MQLTSRAVSHLQRCFGMWAPRCLLLVGLVMGSCGDGDDWRLIPKDELTGIDDTIAWYENNLND